MDVVSVVLWTFFGWMAFSAIAPRFTSQEQRWMRYSFALHVVFGILHVWVVKYMLGGGDMFWYHRAGTQLAELWQSDPQRWTGELLKLTFRIKATFPFWVHGAGGTSTGAMFGVSAWVLLICGKSLYGACVLLSILNFFSRIVVYTVFRRIVAPFYHRYLALAILLLPSAVFWTAGLIKESVAMTGVGIAVLGGYLLAERSAYVRGIGLVAAGGFTAYLVKPYVLFPFFIAVPVWYLAYKLREESGGAAILLTPMRFVMFGVLLVAGLGVLAVAVPSLSVDALGDELASVQHAGTTVGGATNYQLVAATEGAEANSLGLRYAPVAFLFAITRPWFFEVRSVQVAIAAFESTILAFILMRAIWTIGAWPWLRSLLAQPWLLFCASYVVIFGTAVGLGSTNVGSLSRYRVPMMGFYAVIVAFSYVRSKGSVPVDLPADAEFAPTPSAKPVRGRRREPLRIRRKPTGDAPSHNA